MPKKNPTVLILLDEYSYGGVTSFTSIYAKILLQSGFEVIVLGFSSDISNIKQIFPGCVVKVVNHRLGQGLPGRLRSLFPFWRALSAINTEYSISSIHLSLSWSLIYLSAVPKLWRATRIATFYGAYDLESISQKNFLNQKITTKEKVASILRKQLQRMVFNVSDIIIVFSEYALQLLEDHFSKHLTTKTVVIPGMLSEKDILKNPIKPIKSQQLTIVNIGRAEPRKGLQLLLEAVALLKKDHLSIRLIIASPVDYYLWYNLLYAYQEKNLFLDVHLVHAVNAKQKRILLKMADVFVMPSLDLETFGLTMIESLSMGVPVIGTPAGAIPEVLRLIDQRLVAKEISAASLARSIKWFYFLSQKEKFALRKKSLQIVKEHFVTNKYRAQFVALHS